MNSNNKPKVEPEIIEEPKVETGNIEEPKVETGNIKEPKVESPNLEEMFVKNNAELKEWIINLFTAMQKSTINKEPEVPKKKELDDF